MRPLDAPAEVEEQPAGAARHVLLGKPRQRGAEADDVVDGGEQRVEMAARRHEFLPHLAQERSHGHGHVGGETVAQRTGQALDRVQHRREPTPLRADHRQALLEGSALGHRQRRLAWHQAGTVEQPSELAQFRGVTRPDDALGDAARRGAQQARVVVQALDVASKPEEVVGDAALQVRATTIDVELMEAPR